MFSGCHGGNDPTQQRRLTATSPAGLSTSGCWCQLAIVLSGTYKTMGGGRHGLDERHRYQRLEDMTVASALCDRHTLLNLDGHDQGISVSRVQLLAERVEPRKEKGDWKVASCLIGIDSTNPRATWHLCCCDARGCRANTGRRQHEDLESRMQAKVQLMAHHRDVSQIQIQISSQGVDACGPRDRAGAAGNYAQARPGEG